MDKKYMATNAQMQLLRSRGLKISGSYEKKILEKENYYTLINGYKALFLDNTHQGKVEKYKTGATLKELYALFLFDRELRSLFLRYILEIENNIRSVIAHDFSKKYGHENYLRIDNFDMNHSNIGEIANTIAILQRDIANQIKKKNPMILHYIITYGYVPPWVLVNISTLGTISMFYSFLKQRDQNDIGKQFKIMPHEMKIYLKNLSIARNCCAHDERFYNKRFKAFIPSNIIHAHLNIPVLNSGEYAMGKDDIFSLVIIMKNLLTKRTFNKFISSFKILVENLSKKLNTISMQDVNNKLGLPTNWLDIKNC